MWYLGNLLSAQGIEPSPEKLKSLRGNATTQESKGNKTISWISRGIIEMSET